MSQATQRVAIVGGGIAGLSAGIYARLAGLEADVYERNPVPGGECTGWDRRGHHIDNCIHWLTGTDPSTDLYKVWEETGALSSDTAYAPIDAFYSARCSSHVATLWHDLDRTERELVQVAPEDEREIRTLMRHVRLAGCCVVPAEKPMEMMGPLDYLRLGMRMRGMPKVMRRYGGISIGQLADRLKSPVLRLLLGSYMPREFAAYTFVVSYAAMASGNGRLPLGGSRAMARRMADRLEGLGGRLHLGAGVSRIATAGGRASGIVLEDGTTVDADFVVPAVDIHLLRELLPDSMDARLLTEAPDADPRSYPTQNGMQVAFSAPRDAVPSMTTLFEVEPMDICGKTIGALAVKPYDYEAGWAPGGRIVLQCAIGQTDADYACWSKLSKQGYQEEKRRVAEQIEQRVVAEFPGLDGDLELLDAWTPLTYERYCGAYRGSYMAFGMRPGVEAFKAKGTLGDVKGVYLAGQWTMSPGGLPIAVVSGKFAVQRILRSLGSVKSSQNRNSPGTQF